MDRETTSNPTLGNGDRLQERLADVDLDEEHAATTDELRDRLNLPHEEALTDAIQELRGGDTPTDDVTDAFLDE
jgi:hypothetical protein